MCILLEKTLQTLRIMQIIDQLFIIKKKFFFKIFLIQIFL